MECIEKKKVSWAESIEEDEDEQVESPMPLPTLTSTPELPDLPLYSSWSLYYHEAFNRDWSEKSYKHIYTFSTVKNFWRLMNNMPKYGTYFLFLMRDNHPPIWEREENKGSGWVYRIPKEGKYFLNMETTAEGNNKREKQPYGFNVFVGILLYIVGETICEDSHRIIGLSLSPKKEEIVIRLWDSEEEKDLVFSPEFDVKEILNNKPHKNIHGVVNESSDYSSDKNKKKKSSHSNYRGEKT